MRDKLTSFLTVVVMMLILAVGITKAQGDPPETITYQGHLLDAANDPVPDDTYSMSFELYDDDTAGSSIWGPEAISVTTSSGYFSVLLGETEPITSGLLTTGTWLEVVVEGETMTPRHQFGSVPFALNASEVQEFTIGDLSCTHGQVAQWNTGVGAWECGDASTGDIAAVNAGTGLAGGGDSGAVTVTLDYTETGDISSVVAGDGLSGGGETGSVTLTLDYTDTLGGLDCSTDQIAEYNGSEWQCTDPVTGTSGGGSSELTVSYGSGADGDATISSNTDLGSDNTKYYDDLTINNGVVLSANSPFVIYVAGTLTLNGDIAVNDVGGGGTGGTGNDGGDGGDGGGVGGLLYVYANSVSGSGSLRANGASGDDGSASGGGYEHGADGASGDDGTLGSSFGSNTGGGGGFYWRYGGEDEGSGGAGTQEVTGFLDAVVPMVHELQCLNTSDALFYRAEGGGGGGEGGASSSSDRSSGGGGGGGGGGAGGGGDGSNGTSVNSTYGVAGGGGGGGGGGGQLVFATETSSPGITLQAVGGDGGDGGCNDGGAGGAGGGGGGGVVVYICDTPSIDVSGGSGGDGPSGCGDAPTPDDGEAGSSGVIIDGSGWSGGSALDWLDCDNGEVAIFNTSTMEWECGSN